MDQGDSSPNRAHDETQHDTASCMHCAHGDAIAIVGTNVGPNGGTGFVSLHEDGRLIASPTGTGQRRPYELTPARDGNSWRSPLRGKRGEAVRKSIEDRFLSGTFVKADRLGRDPGHGISEDDAKAILDHVRRRINEGSTITDALHDTAEMDVPWSHATVKRIWSRRHESSPRADPPRETGLFLSPADTAQMCLAMAEEAKHGLSRVDAADIVGKALGYQAHLVDWVVLRACALNQQFIDELGRPPTWEEVHHRIVTGPFPFGPRYAGAEEHPNDAGTTSPIGP
jgi:hypothetical protein